MRTFRSLCLAACLLSFLLNGSADAEPPETLEIGEPAPTFDLKGVDGEHHRLSDYAQAKVLAVIFTCNHCPTAQAYEQRIKKLASDYEQDRLAVVAISPNDPKALRLNELGYSDLNDTYADMKIRARDHAFNFPYLYDGDTQAVSKKYGPIATPHVFIFGPERKLRYEGGFDDAENPAKVEHRYARDAVEALLEDKPVPTKQANVFGCSVKWASKRAKRQAHRKKLNQQQATLDTIDLPGVKKLVQNDTKKVRLINVWATWCGPCVAELDDLVEIHRMYGHRDFELITISIDQSEQRDKALAVLNKHHAANTNYIFDGDQNELVETLDPKWRGPVPFSVLIGPGGDVLERQQGRLEPLKMKRAIVSELGRTYFAD